VFKVKPDKSTAAFIKRNCANYAGDGHCLLETTQGNRLCPFIHDIPIVCNYGLNSVLAGDPALLAKYKLAAGDANDGKACVDCSRSFNAKSNRQERCGECAAKHRKRKRSEYNLNYQIRKHRAGS
jgi:predicted nucleic acid-binding Zn ribbon protein